jgi:hypothetical protein
MPEKLRQLLHIIHENQCVPGFWFLQAPKRSPAFSGETLPKVNHAR